MRRRHSSPLVAVLAAARGAGGRRAPREDRAARDRARRLELPRLADDDEAARPDAEDHGHARRPRRHPARTARWTSTSRRRRGRGSRSAIRARTPGTSRTIIFRKAGIYRLTATNVQTPEERGLIVLGEANTLTLTVVVK